MRARSARTVFGLVACLAGVLTAAMGQTAPQPVPVQSATAAGITVRITSVRWGRPEEAFCRSSGGPWATARVLLVEYEVQATDRSPQWPRGKTVASWVVSVQPRDPRGEAISHTRWTRPDGEHSPQNSEWGFSSDSVDPRWESLTLEFEILDPAAPPEATGEFEETLEFKNLPVPHRPNEILALGRSLTTSRGTRFVLEGVRRLTFPHMPDEYKEAFEFAIRWLAPTNVPDLCVLPPRVYRVVGDQVADLGRGGSLGSMLPVGNTDRCGRGDFHGWQLPSPTAKTFSLSIQTREIVPSLRQAKWIHPVKLTVRPCDIPLESVPAPAKPLASTTTGGVTVALEDLRADFQGQYFARLWLRDSGGLFRSSSEWVLRDVALQGDTPNWNVNMLQSANLCWKTNGSPPLADEHGWERHGSPFGSGPLESRPKPKKLSLKVELDPVRITRHAIEFSGVQIPPLYELIRTGRLAPVPSGSLVTLTEVFNFPEYELPPVNRVTGYSPSYTQFLPPQGMGLGFEYQPGANKNVNLTLTCTSASDDHGRSMGHAWPIRVQQGDVLYGRRGIGEFKFRTLLLHPPFPDAKTLNVQMWVEEVNSIGRKKTVVFRNLPVPEPPTTADASRPRQLTGGN